MRIRFAGAAALSTASTWQRFAVLTALVLLLCIAAAGASAAEGTASGGIGERHAGESIVDAFRLLSVSGMRGQSNRSHQRLQPRISSP